MCILKEGHLLCFVPLFERHLFLSSIDSFVIVVAEKTSSISEKSSDIYFFYFMKTLH